MDLFYGFIHSSLDQERKWCYIKNVYAFFISYRQIDTKNKYYFIVIINKENNIVTKLREDEE